LAQTKEHFAPLKHLAADLLSAEVDALEEVGGGRNSRVYRMVVRPSKAFALKAYFRHASDKRDRMRTEFDSLCFLWENGLRNIPKPVIASPEHDFAIYHWIEASKIGLQDVSDEAIRAATCFLGKLVTLRTHSNSRVFRAASEACFSGASLLENLSRRLQPLLARTEEPELQAFLSHKFIPSLQLISDWSRRQAGSDFDAELNHELRILSPSDFGFHNALQKQDGTIFFLDFEYFGWDDPAKTISDFLLHPAMTLSPALKRQFVASTVENLGCTEIVVRRLKALYPLFGLKWCLILLNEFLPDQLQRRRFAGNAYETLTQAAQLNKAEDKLQQTLTEYEHLPYID
jgi:Phosphotransferase enzyme family